MAKTNTPFLSLASRGTVGESLTSQKGSGSTILRTKPAPTDRYTLGQAYQRWLYEDYAYLWTQQSAAIQAQYRSAGVRFHLTGFQYWMKDMLTRLPDIAGWWKLDDNLGPTTIDSSRNSNTGTIIGASPSIGRIDGALLFDGINNEITVPINPSLEITTALSIECFIYLDRNSSANSNRFLGKEGAYALQRHPFNGTGIRFGIWDAGGIPRWSGTATLNWNQWHHIAGLWSPTYLGGMVKIFSDAIDAGWGFTANDIIPNALMPFSIGQARAFLGGHLDNCILTTRVISQATLLRHSLRRYPP